MSLESFFSKHRELSNLLDRKISLIQSLIIAEKSLSTTVMPGEADWISAFPIESIKHLVVPGKLKTRLGEFKVRTDLKKTCNKILDELDSLDNQIKISVLDFLIEKINLAVESNE